MDVNKDPLASQRIESNNLFAKDTGDDTVGQMAASPPHSAGFPQDRRMSKEWDASKTVPSKFQKRENSIYATPGSRDSHTGKGHDRDKNFHDLLKNKGWFKS